MFKKHTIIWIFVVAMAASVTVAVPGRAQTTFAPGTYVPGEVVVSFAAGVTENEQDEIHERVAHSLVRDLAAPRMDLVRLSEGTTVDEAIAAYEDTTGVAYAEPNFIRTRLATPNDPSFSQLWGLENSGQTVAGSTGTADADIDAAQAWDVTKGSSTVKVAVVDDGVGNHPDLGSNVGSGWDFVGGDPNAEPASGGDNSHGTHVAGTIGALGNNSAGVTGVNWRVSLMPLRIFDEDGFTTTSRIVNAFTYAGANGAKVVNGSFGGGSFSRAESDAITNAPNTLFVFAAGNDGTDNDERPMYPCAMPQSNVVCVAASTNRDALASFSNYGDTTVDLAAPGSRILSTVMYGSGYDYYSGTSMASPHVAGAAGLLWAAAPAATVNQIRNALFNGADDLPAFAGRVSTNGRLNVARSMALLTGSVSGPRQTLTVTRIKDGGGGKVTSSPTGISCGQTCSASFPEGRSVTLTATPNSTSSFVGWGGACSGTATTCTVTMNAATQVSATFAPL